MKFACARAPLPGIRTTYPRNIGPVNLVEALVGPPGALSVREGIGIAQDSHTFNAYIHIGLIGDGGSTDVP